MPMFDYQCTECAHKAETIAKADDKHLECPKCGKCSFEQLLSATHFFNFKGDGTYDKGFTLRGRNG